MTVSSGTVKVYSVREEAVRFDSATRVDRENKVIRDVVVLGHRSDNGRIYPQSVMEAALSRYDAVPVKVDHPELDKARSTRPLDTTWGWIENPRVVVEAGEPKIRGDISYLDSHPSTQMLLERIESHPDKIGLSHNADVHGDMIEGNTVFEVSEILEVRSVDLVENPATTRGIFESKEQGGPTVANQPKKRRMKLRGILEGADYIAGKAASLSGKAVVEMIDEEHPEVLDIEMEVDDAQSPEEGVKAGIRMAIMAVLDDESLSAEELVTKIRELLAAKEAATGGGETEAATEQDDEEEEAVSAAAESRGNPQKGTAAAAESKRIAALESQLAEIKRERDQAVLESRCRTLLEEAGVEATENRVRVLSRCDNDGERAALIGDWPKRGDELKPRRSPSVLGLESTRDYSDFDYDAENIAKALKY